MTTDITALRAAYAEATPGHYRMQPTDFDDGGIAIVAHIVQGGEVLDTPANGMVAYVTLSSVERDSADDARAKRDAALFIALHNAFPAMADEIEALRAEVARLRAEFDRSAYPYDSDQMRDKPLDAMQSRMIARAALKGPTDDQ